MNLFEMAVRGDKHLVFSKSSAVVPTKQRVNGSDWRGLALNGDADLVVSDALRWYPFCERPGSTGWHVVALEDAAIGGTLVVRLVDRKTRAVVAQVDVDVTSQLRDVPFPPAPPDPGLACDLELSLRQQGAARAFLAVHLLLNRVEVIGQCRGTGIELGPGANPQILPSPGIDVIYLEQSSVAEWKDRYNKSGKYAVESKLWDRYRIGEAHALPVTDETLDFIFSSHVFEHLANPLGHLKHWFTKLRPGGVVAAVVPDVGGCKDYVFRPCPFSDMVNELAAESFRPTLTQYARWAQWKAPRKDPGDLLREGVSIHVHFYTRSNIEELLRYAVAQLGYAEFRIWHSRNSKDFFFLLRKATGRSNSPVSQVSETSATAAAREVALALRPAPALEPIDGDRWRAANGPIRFELDPGRDRLPVGWVLMRTKLSRTILDGSSVLVAETGTGEVGLKVPVAVGGSVFEVLELPLGTRRLCWQPSRLSGTFQQTPVTLRALGALERRWLMLRRVLSRCWIESGEARERVGLSWWRPWFDLEGQYRACGELRDYAHQIPYADWIERFDRLNEHDRRRIERRIAKLRRAPHFDIVVQGEGTAAAETRRSIDAQLYRRYSLIDPTAKPDPTHYVSVLQAGDRLAEHALYWAAEAIVAGSNVAMAYADEDIIDPAGVRSEPNLKPDWSPEHLRSINYVGRWALIRGAELEAAGGLSQDSHTLNLRVAGVLGAAKVVHLPAVLYHRASVNPPSRPAARAHHPLPVNPPLASIIIPTRDGEALLRNCIESIERASSYRNYEILVVDNQSSEESTLRYLASLKHRVLRYEREFNYSAINNLGVSQARGEVVLLLNNDTEVISPDWLEEMLGHLHQEGVGVVGAKLLYADGSVQHAGDAVGPGGCADHMHAGIARDAPGYCYRAIVAQEVSAVTGACLMTRKELYQRLGGLDETHLPVSFNDVDYCLRVQQAGQRVIFTPHAALYHHESATRGRDRSAAQATREAREMGTIRRRWRKRLEHDPYYNPNLSYRFPDFTLSNELRVKKPWVR